ncbi:hypothetical protein GB937_004127 [Aspergillus fischeri]|nr:hypothetical protein GB937_004127 [Aspergillus fischeri]
MPGPLQLQSHTRKVHRRQATWNIAPRKRTDTGLEIDWRSKGSYIKASSWRLLSSALYDGYAIAHDALLVYCPIHRSVFERNWDKKVMQTGMKVVSLTDDDVLEK